MASTSGAKGIKTKVRFTTLQREEICDNTTPDNAPLTFNFLPLVLVGQYAQSDDSAIVCALCRLTQTMMTLWGIAIGLQEYHATPLVAGNRQQNTFVVARYL